MYSLYRILSFVFCVQLISAQLEEWKIPCGAIYMPKNCENASYETLDTVEDFERCAPARLDTVTRDYIWSGSGEQFTLFENKAAFKRLFIKKRILRGITNATLGTTVVDGYNISFPVGISPTSGQAFCHPDGDIGVAKATAAMGTVMIVNCFSATPLEDVASSVAPNGELWMQFYVFNDLGVVLNIIRRAEAAGYKALVVSSDEPPAYDIRCHARHRFSIERSLPRGLPNIVNYTSALDVDHTFSFGTITWLSWITKLPIIVKGVMTGEDAKKAIAAGAAAIIVSNHGGRELDFSLSTIDVLPEIVRAVRHSVRPSTDVYVDGGIRTGGDVFKALARGAKATFIGRPPLWGLTIGGEKGVMKVLSILKEEFMETMVHAGFSNPGEIPKSSLISRCNNPDYK